MLPSLCDRYAVRTNLPRPRSLKQPLPTLTPSIFYSLCAPDSMVSAQQTNLLPENASPNNASYPKVYITYVYQTTSQCLSFCSCTITVLYIYTYIRYTSQVTYANTTNFEKFCCGFLQMPSSIRTMSHRMSVPCLRNVCILPMLCPWIGHGV